MDNTETFERPARGAGFSQESKQRAIDMYKNGATLAEISKIIGATGSTISDWAHKAGYRKHAKSGTGKPAPKTTNEPKAVPVEVVFCSHCGNRLPNAYIVR